ncbi:MAG: hypothetical protein GWP15_00310 [Nitrospirae bacterium]|nr:hypothetical protein [Nitrospirota bacterium]
MNKYKIFTAGRTIALVGATLLAVSAFLPWGKSAYVSVTGIGGDGLIQISIGILAFLLLFIKRITIWFSLLLGVAGLAIGIVDFVVMIDAIKKVTDGAMGIGLYTTLGATLGIVIGTIVEIFEERNKKLRKNLAYLDDE